MAKFVALLTYGNHELKNATRPRHREYLRSLLEQGKLVASGPFADDSGALIIYEAADEAEARSILANDPFSEGDVIAKSELKQWNRVLPEP